MVRVMRISRQKLARAVADWQAAGIVDADTAVRILSHEAQQPQRMPGALVMLGGLAVALGLAALVSANWDAIPVTLKLGAHMVLTAGLGIAAWLRTGTRGIGSGPGLEVLLILLSASALALIAHVGQSFNLQGGPAGLLGFWLAVASPFTLVLARSGIHRWLWTIGLVAFLGFWLEQNAEWLHEARLLTSAAVLAGLIAYAAPLAGRRGWLDTGWADHLRGCALAALVVAVSGAQFGWYLDGTETELRDGAVDILVGAVVAMAGLAALTAVEGRRAPFAGPAAAVLVLAPVAGALPVVTAAFLVGTDSMWVAAAGFCLVWLTVAKLALDRHATGLFRLATVLVALRLAVVFLEAAGGLMATGAGLVIGGLLLIAVGYGARAAIRWAERRAPASGDGGGR